MANVGTAAAGKTLIGGGIGASPTFANIGTNSGLTAHGPVIAEGNGAFVASSPGSAGQVLTSNGVSSDPSFQTISASGAITTITGNSGGAETPLAGNFNILGTGSITSVGSANTETVQLTGLTNHTVLVGAGTATITKVGPGSSGQVLQSGGASADPAYSTATFPSTATGTGTILRADGTNWVATTNTYPNTTTQGSLLVGTASNVIGSLAAVATGQVLTSAGTSTVPVYSATPTVSSITFGSGSALSSYVEFTTWTPVVTFGGGSTGITYSKQFGFYTRIGNVVYYTWLFQFSSKGSSSGNAVITGLPFTSNATTGSGCPSVVNVNTAFTFTATYGVLLGVINSNSSSITLSQITTTNANLATATDVNFANTTQLQSSGFYFI